MTDDRTGTTACPCLVLMLVAAIAAVLVVRGTAGAESQHEDAIAALENAGAIVSFKDADAARKNSSRAPVEVVFLSGGRTAVEAVPFLRQLANAGEATLEFRSLDAGQAKNLSAHAEILARLNAVEIGVSLKTPIDDAGVCDLSKIPNLRRLSISSLDRLDVTDAGLACLAGLKELKSLSLNNTRITDAGLAHLKELKNLELLSLMMTDITGSGLRHLEGLPIQTLVLIDTKVNDEALQALRDLGKLEQLFLTGCPIRGTSLKHLSGAGRIDSSAQLVENPSQRRGAGASSRAARTDEFGIARLRHR